MQDQNYQLERDAKVPNECVLPTHLHNHFLNVEIHLLFETQSSPIRWRIPTA